MARMATRPNPPLIHLIVAMVVVMIPALLAFAFFTRIPEPPVNKVDPAPIVELAVQQAPYAVAVPTNLPDGWVCTRARWTPQGEPGLGATPAPGNTFALGYLTPQQLYIAVDQRDVSSEALVSDVTRTGRADGTSSVAGASWTRYRSADGRTRALVLKESDHVTIVSGDLGYEALDVFAGTLSFTRS